jgi:hypothetical protein
MLGEVLMLKLLTVALAGVATTMFVRRIMGELESARIKVKASQPQSGQVIRPLRQDPRTGVYYPAE